VGGNLDVYSCLTFFIINRDRVRFFFKPIRTGLENFLFRSQPVLKIKKSGAGYVVCSDVNVLLMSGLIGFKIFTNRSKPVLKIFKPDHDRFLFFSKPVVIGLSKS